MHPQWIYIFTVEINIYIHTNTTDVLYLVQLQLYDPKLVWNADESKKLYSSVRNTSSKLPHIVSTQKGSSSSRVSNWILIDECLSFNPHYENFFQRLTVVFYLRNKLMLLAFMLSLGTNKYCGRFFLTCFTWLWEFVCISTDPLDVSLCLCRWFWDTIFKNCKYLTHHCTLHAEAGLPSLDMRRLSHCYIIIYKGHF